MLQLDVTQLSLTKQKQGSNNGYVWKCLEESVILKYIHLNKLELSHNSHLSKIEVCILFHKINLELGGSGVT